MSVILGVASVLMGAVLGSFLNALSFRWGTGRGMGGRSRCMHCNETLRAADLVPVLSYAALRGKCRYCRSKVSFQYPAVELAAALLSLAVYVRHPDPAAYAAWLLIWMTVLFLVLYDIRHTVLPKLPLALLMAMAFLSLFFSCDTACLAHPPAVSAALAGPLIGLPLLLLSLISGGRWMGWGDGVLAFALGWLLGLAQGFFALLVAFWSGAIIGVALIFIGKSAQARFFGKRIAEVTMESEVPFAPFLALGAAIAHFFNVDIFSILLF